ncbi:MAG: serine--tRNA ligase [Planctomycetaceae bacterium]
MLDLQYICDNIDAIKKNCHDRGVKVDLGEIVSLREKRGQLIVKGDELRRKQKEVSSQIPKASADDKPTLIAQGRELREQIAAVEADLKQVEADILTVQLQIPNLTHPDAPISEDESGYVTLKEIGDKPNFDFETKDHVALADHLGLINFEAGARVAGSGFYFLTNDAVMLEMALVQYALEKLRSEGFVLCTTPDLARNSVLEGIGFNPRGDETQIYAVENTDLSLVATAEITLGGMYQDQVMQAADLPLKLAGLSHCFRTEAGAAGAKTRGIYRVHQFTKVEMFAFTEPDLEKSDAMHQDLLRIEEEIFQGIGVPYRVIDTPTGDLGGPAYRKFDLEAWMPGRGEAGEYGEITSTSNCTDYQARRLGIRCKKPDKKGTEFVHTLNGTAVAVTRAMISVLENNQTADGTVIVPEVLRKWVGRDAIVPIS